MGLSYQARIPCPPGCYVKYKCPGKVEKLEGYNCDGYHYELFDANGVLLKTYVLNSFNTTTQPFKTIITVEELFEEEVRNSIPHQAPQIRRRSKVVAKVRGGPDDWKSWLIPQTPKLT